MTFYYVIFPPRDTYEILRHILKASATAVYDIAPMIFIDSYYADGAEYRKEPRAFRITFIAIDFSLLLRRILAALLREAFRTLLLPPLGPFFAPMHCFFLGPLRSSYYISLLDTDACRHYDDISFSLMIYRDIDYILDIFHVIILLSLKFQG